MFWRRERVVAALFVAGVTVAGALGASSSVEATAATYEGQSASVSELSTRAACTETTYHQHLEALEPALWWSFDSADPSAGGAVGAGDFSGEGSLVECDAPGMLALPDGSVQVVCDHPVTVGEAATVGMWVAPSATANLALLTVATDAGPLTVTVTAEALEVELAGVVASGPRALPAPDRAHLLTVGTGPAGLDVAVDGKVIASAPGPVVPGSMCPTLGEARPHAPPVYVDDLFIVDRHLSPAQARDLYEANHW